MRDSICAVNLTLVKDIEKIISRGCPRFRQWMECSHQDGQLTMGKVLLNELGILVANDHLHGAAAVLTACQLNTFAKARI
jgi:hypothetical protein